MNLRLFKYYVKYLTVDVTGSGPQLRIHVNQNISFESIKIAEFNFILKLIFLDNEYKETKVVFTDIKMNEYHFKAFSENISNFSLNHLSVYLRFYTLSPSYILRPEL